MNVAGAKSLRKIKRLKKIKLECDDIEIVIKKKFWCEQNIIGKKIGEA